MSDAGHTILALLDKDGLSRLLGHPVLRKNYAFITGSQSSAEIDDAEIIARVMALASLRRLRKKVIQQRPINERDLDAFLSDLERTDAFLGWVFKDQRETLKALIMQGRENRAILLAKTDKSPK